MLTHFQYPKSQIPDLMQFGVFLIWFRNNPYFPKLVSKYLGHTQPLLMQGSTPASRIKTTVLGIFAAFWLSLHEHLFYVARRHACALSWGWQITKLQFPTNISESLSSSVCDYQLFTYLHHLCAFFHLKITSTYVISTATAFPPGSSVLICCNSIAKWHMTLENNR